jgi:acyl carrier protein
MLAAVLASAALAPEARAQTKGSPARDNVHKPAREAARPASPPVLLGRPVEGFVAPRTAIEMVVASVYREVLGAPPVGAGDSFPVLGGHSLTATAAAVRLQERLGVRVEPQLLLCGKNVAEVAAALEARGAKPVAVPARATP